MGGDICVGVRLADGSEHIRITWTNWLPILFMEPALYTDDGGEPIKELLNEKQRPRQITHSQYGVVLLDLKLLEGETQRHILTNNGYFTPLHPSLAAPHISSNPRHDVLMLHHLERGVPITSMTKDGWLPLSQEEAKAAAKAYWRALYAKSRESVRGLIPFGQLDLSDMAVVERADRVEGDAAKWRKVHEWVAARGWSTRVNKSCR